ncbi:MAG: hypothetical protein ABIS67_13080 [Candidatus Eisenbacteria bacterium]
MRRARWFASIVFAAIAAATGSDAARQTVEMVNGIGIIDYASRPKLKVGSWVSYRMTGTSEMGESDDYNVTILIAGEERFWGEDCFWVETWTEPKDKSPRAVATLMSYAIFEDSLPNLRAQYYIRKTIGGVDADGGLEEQLVRRPPSTLKKRGSLLEAANVKLDTMGTEMVTVKPGTFSCHVVRWQEGKLGTVDQRDSSITTELRETRMTYLSPAVPVTGLARESLDRSIKRRSWAIGRSQDAATWITMDRATGESLLTGFGEGQKARLLPEARQVSLRERDAATKRTAAPARPRSASTARKKS